MITVFYDGKCGVCKKEIEYYIGIAPDGLFNWVDITINKHEIENIGILYVDALKLLHAVDAKGDIYIGVDAFILIWSNIPRWKILAKIVNNFLIRPIANIMYKVFASWRFNRLSHCKNAISTDCIIKK